MKTYSVRSIAAVVAVNSTFLAGAQAGPDLIHAIILTGVSNHNWRYTSRVHRDTLEESGRFAVDIADDAVAALSDRAAMGRYQLFVLDYNSDTRWGEPAETNFADAVREGAGVVVIHAANNAFPGWTDYEKMVGLLWRQGTGHGKFHEFPVRYVDTQHPITAGLADMVNHPDELYHRLVNAQGTKPRILATAFATTESGGTGQDEPMAFVLEFGKGRVFHTTLGHVWEGQESTKPSISDPQFKILLARGAEWAATGQVTIGLEWSDRRAHNTLTEAEKTAGWELLFDGSVPGSFRGYKEPGFPGEGWAARNGTLYHAAGQGGPDLITREKYADFEFACEWKVAPGGNSGIMYRVAETDGPTYMTGPELQILDNERHPDSKSTKTSAGALYGLVACAYDVVRPAGQWNAVRIVVKGNHVEHWVNGWKVAQAELNSPEWDQLIKGTKFEPWKQFGRMPAGHVALQNHGDEVWFRDLKIRSLK
jgi:type 1 glutamine amidotransferase